MFVYFVKPSQDNVAIATQTHPEVARSKTLDKSTSSAEKSANRMSSSTSRKSSSANSEKSVSSKFVPSASQRVFQQRNVKASMSVLVHLSCF